MLKQLATVLLFSAFTAVPATAQDSNSPPAAEIVTMDKADKADKKAAFDADAWIKAAGERINDPAAEGWSYTKTVESDGDIEVERYDAAASEDNRWSLVSVNGKTPKKKRLKKYRKAQKAQRERLAEAEAKRAAEKAEKNTEEEAEDGNLKIGVNPEDMVYEREEEDAYIYSFQPKFDPKIDEFLVGEMRVAKDQPRILSLSMHNTGKFSAGPATIKKARIEMTTSQVGDAVFMTRFSILMKGKAFLFVSINQDHVETLSDFSKPIPAATATAAATP